MAAEPKMEEGMKRQRQVCSGELKARVALEAIKGQHTIREIASRYSVHPNLVTRWRKQAMEELPGLFSDGRARKEKEDEQKQAELYEQLGRMKMELEWLKKKTSMLG